jgi:hypothetical protein
MLQENHVFKQAGVRIRGCQQIFIIFVAIFVHFQLCTFRGARQQRYDHTNNHSDLNIILVGRRDHLPAIFL